MEINYRPSSGWGKLSVALLIAFMGSLLTGMILTKTIGRGNEFVVTVNLLLIAPMIGAGITILGAFITGLIAIFKKKERSILVILSTMLGLYMPFMIAGELLFSH